MYKKFLGTLKIIGAIILAILVLTATISIIWRTLSNYIDGMDGSSMFWANELQQLLFHWVIVIGAILAYQNRSHLNITVIYSMFKGVGKCWLDRILNLMTAFVFGVILIWGVKLVFTEIDTKTPALELSRGIFVYAPYVALSIFIVIHQAYQFLHSFTRKAVKENEL